MKIKFPFSVNIKFPGNMEYIPAVRKFVSELLQVCNFSPKFSYRTEIIIDEICSNSVLYGCKKEDAEIELTNTVYEDRVEINIKDQGGKKEDIKRLKNAIKRWEGEKTDQPKEGLGLEIVRMLSERLDVVIDENNLTSVHVVRKREDELS
ncbi:MAG: ATP-binding protein [Chitinispirillaceae bacterium]|nr:ATP-binding protein [Chitinispirillaceae bacterium]